MYHTILGSGGAIGTPLARELRAYTHSIRLVSRHPRAVSSGDELFALDAGDLTGLDKAIAGSAVVYVTIGFEYKLSVWRSTWPPFMKAVIEACSRHNARLVFFDNMYLYAASAVPHMTEEAAIDPPSEKGKVRAQVHRMIFEAVEAGRLQALIARSADFYGPENKASALQIMVADNFRKGKKAQAFGNVDKLHTYTFTPDAARATALLGNTADAFNQVWHVPTTRQRWTTRQWVECIAREMQVEPRIQAVPRWIIKSLGLFMPIMREFPEMLYQYEQDYVFDSSKFERTFGWGATDPEAGVKAMVRALTAHA